MREGFETMLASIRAQAGHRMSCDGYDSSFDPLRKAIVVAEVLNYIGAQVPEARELVGEVRDLIMQVRAAKELTPTLQHFL